MKATVKVLFNLPLSGSTDFQNRSKLELGGAHGTNVLGSSWSLGVARLRTYYSKLQLTIPSGVLSLEGEWKAGDLPGSAVFHGDGTWEGKAAGLLGGMSGYGHFNAQVLCVTEGVFLHPAEPLMDAKIYFCRKETYFLLYGGTEVGDLLLKSRAKGFVPDDQWAGIIEVLDKLNGSLDNIKLFYGRVRALERHLYEVLQRHKRESRMELAGPEQFGDASESRMELAGGFGMKDLGDLTDELEGSIDPREFELDDPEYYHID
jgi:hypothetical protein